jgi:hypothetical protein
MASGDKFVIAMTARQWSKMCATMPGDTIDFATHPVMSQDFPNDKRVAKLIDIELGSHTMRLIFEEKETFVGPDLLGTASPLENEKGLRYNKGKLRMELIPVEWTWALAAILTKGAEKYAARNWEKGLSDADTIGCLKRHIAKWEAGESYDVGVDPQGRPNTGCHHMAIAAWNCLVLMTQELRGTGTRDYPRNSLDIVSKVVTTEKPNG